MKFLNLSMVGLIGVVISSTALAGVKSFSKEIYTKNSDTDVYWEVTVRCSDNNKKRVIRQAVKGDDQWCAKEVPSLCGRTKMNTARAVCTNRYTRGLKQNTNKAESEQVAVKKPVAVAKTQPKVQETPKAAKVVAPVASVDSVSSGSDDLSIQQGQVSIEEKRLDIEQQKLELRKRELELQKQELQLKQKQQLIKQ